MVMACTVLVECYSAAQSVDPRNPTEMRERLESSRDEIKGWLPVRIKALEKERAELKSAIARLPQHTPSALPDHMGYHSTPWDDSVTVENGRHQIDVEFTYDPKLSAIALVPALVPKVKGSYAFPKRFKIEIIDRGSDWVGGGSGKWVIPPPPYKWVEVVNWMDEDFPDPGSYPVFFNIGDMRVYHLRVTIPKTDPGLSYCALGEMYLFRQHDHSHRMGDNMMVWGKNISISTSDSLSKSPLWDDSYLYDGITGLGLPLSEEISDHENFMISWEPDNRPVQIVLDLGTVRTVGRIQLFPAEAPQGMAIPQFGFPGQVTAEFSASTDFKDAEVFVEKDIRSRLNNASLLNIVTGAHKIRYIRLTLDDLSTYKGKTILGLGEIQASEYDEVWSLNCKVSAKGIPASGIDQLPRLVDGYSQKRRILREADWIQGLAMRRPLDRRLSVVEAELDTAYEAWAGLKLHYSIWGGGVIGLILLIAMGLQRVQRYHVLKKLKMRITRDLHDEVGSSLGGITLVARRMETVGATPPELSELSLMAREASASLRDVVWVIDQTKICLPDLLNLLGERARRILSGIELTVEIPKDCPDHEVPLPFKRHLLMYFKEAVHNCARHSGATKVLVKVTFNKDLLTLSLCDNGCGFDPAAKREGWGVDSMKKRAEELGGRMDLQSAPGKGTSIAVILPLREIICRTDHSYKTSN